VRVDFRVRTNTNSAVLVLTDAHGRPLSAGLQGQLEGGEAFIIGYDGRAWVKDLAPQNTLSVALEPGVCHASFPYSARANEQVIIPVTCR